MKVLSLFDGISCGMIALERAEIPVEKYVAYEIDENAIKVSKQNYPQIEHCGDVTTADFTQYKGFDLLIGGSPCQSLSIVQSKTRQNLDGKSKLFFEFVRAKNETQPKWFFFANLTKLNEKRKNCKTNGKGDAKMTDKEIIKALEYCQYPDGRYCLSCKYNEEKTMHCETKLREDTIDLINRQKAEIEALNSRVCALNDTNKKLIDSQEIYWKNRVKEFAERLKEKIVNTQSVFSVQKATHDFLSGNAYRQQEILDYIDNLVKEMTEEKENA